MIAGKQLPLNIKLRDEATFANYVGEAAPRLREGGGFVYIWGRRGSGRSHLLEAACHEARDAHLRAMYLVNLHRYEPDILQDLENVPLVCLDDLDMVVGDSRWELALFHLINGARDNGNRLVVSAASVAGRLPVRLDDLRSRLLSAVSIETDRLSDEQRLAALKLRARSRGLDLGDEVGRFILGRTGRGMDHLVDLLHRLDHASLSERKRLTIPFVKQTLQL